MTLFKRMLRDSDKKPKAKRPRFSWFSRREPELGAEELVDTVIQTAVIASEFNRITHDQETRGYQAPDPTPSYDHGSSHSYGSSDSGSSDSGSCGGCD